MIDFSKIIMWVSLTVLASLVFWSNVATASAYDSIVLRDRPVLYVRLSSRVGASDERDLSPKHYIATYLPSDHRLKKARLPNGDTATIFDGQDEYVEIGSDPDFSIPQRGALTIEAWIRPDTLQFPKQEGEGYVHWVGKGTTGQHEYACRMYSLRNSASPERPNRISGYVFNLAGGLGSGAYFQDPITAGEWIYVVVLVDGRDNGTVAIYKNGRLRKTTPLSQFNVRPGFGNAPLRIATRDFSSFFKGAIGKFALYGYRLQDSRIKEHFLAMTVEH